MRSIPTADPPDQDAVRFIGQLLRVKFATKRSSTTHCQTQFAVAGPLRLKFANHSFPRCRNVDSSRHDLGALSRLFLL